MRAVLLLCASLLVGLNVANAQTAQPAVPLDRQPPDYPEAAGNAEGSVKLHFAISKDGHVTDAAVVESTPPGLFDSIAVARVKQWTYRPRLVDGHAVDQPDNMIVVRFKPPTGPELVWLNPSPPFYPREALAAKQEGSVKVGFDLTELGTTTNVHILETTMPGVFDLSAIEDVTQRIFRPLLIDGQPHDLAGQSATLEYKLAGALVRPKATHIVKPAYPQGVTYAHGFCAMYLTINPDGSVADATVLQSFPRGAFEQATLEAVKQWKFETPETTGLPVSRHLHYKFSYEMKGPGIGDGHYLKPGQWIVLDYTLTADGQVKDIAVADQSQAGLPIDKAAKQLANTKLNPIVENGVAVEKQHLRMKFE